jgi:hypothetical protein
MAPSQRTVVTIGLLKGKAPTHLYCTETVEVYTLISRGGRVLAQLIEKCPAFYATQRHTAVFTTTYHWAIS